MTTISPVLIVAHRGASYDAPENTLASMALGWRQQADAVEMDIRLTRDGAIVLLHDETFKRTTGCADTPEALDLAEIRRLDAGRWKAATFAGEKVPTLAEVLAAMPAGKKMLIELKAGVEIVPALQRELAAGPVPLEHVIIIAFDFETLRAAKTAMPRAQALYLAGGRTEAGPKSLRDLDALIEAAHTAGFDGLDLGADWPIDGAFVRRIRDAGLALHVWTVNDGELAKRLVQAGVDGITTDRPGWIREWLKGSGD